ERLALETVEDLARRGLDVLAHRVDRGREVVVARDVVADQIEDRLHLLADRGEDELVAPDGVPSELALIGLDSLVDEAPASIRRAKGRRDLGRVTATGRERRPQLGVVADLVLHP